MAKLGLALKPKQWFKVRISKESLGYAEVAILADSVESASKESLSKFGQHLQIVSAVPIMDVAWVQVGGNLIAITED